MSRIGKKPVALPSGVTVEIKDDREVTVKGPKGELTQKFRPEVVVRQEGDSVIVEKINDTRTANAMHGLTRSLVQNMVTGVTEGYEKKLEIFGTGYLAAVAGNVLQVRVGFAHEVEKPIPAGLTVKCSDAQHVQISGCDKQLVGQFAAEVRAIKKAEPYLGKGIKYEGEVIRRKESKAAGKK
ncbi:MAG: 50S ribosomal protein L6 [Thermoguttaceae bacterium]|jgi:large subunit ribosomal protein L6|nr:50S ribosomal protein L6 [Thermoguttaceae bacterium]